jgi:hypothetical protein
MTTRSVAYFDCFAGISGDMVLGALIDAGVPQAVLHEGLSMLHLTGVTISARPVQRQGLRGLHVTVEADHPPQFHRYQDIRTVIEDSNLPTRVKELSLATFARLASVEAAIHAIPLEDVHFHEIGAIDTVVDIVGSALGLCHLDIEHVVASPLPLAQGWISAAHGTLPLPAPATMALLSGVPVVPARTDGETVTPTGAAIVTTLASAFGALPAMEITGMGYGAGTRDPENAPNLLRIITGIQRRADMEMVWVLETDIDDMNPEFIPYLTQRLLEEGALDVVQIPIQMKKGRPGFTIRILAPENHRDALTRQLMAESTTLGVRMHPVERLTLRREEHEVSTRYGPVQVKVAFNDTGAIITIKPEYESCRQRAVEAGVPLKEVYQEAVVRARDSVP